MSLNFPNPTRSFDERRDAVRFVGHDGVFEIRFFVEAKAFATRDAPSKGLSAATCLEAFDKARAVIQDIARTAYARNGLASYTLSAADFR